MSGPMMQPPKKPSESGCTMMLEVRITPNASRNEIVERLPDGVWRIKVQSPPVEGAANKGLTAFLARMAGVSKSKVRIVRGVTSRRKTIEIAGDETVIMRKLEQEAS
jgi:uncharacterized protein